MKCKECSFYHDGTCRRNPPMPQLYGHGIFPKVLPDAWCGEFVAKAKKEAAPKAAEKRATAQESAEANNEAKETATRATEPQAAPQTEPKPKRKYTRRKK